MSQLSAAELHKKHQLQGAPDPFPSLGDPTPASRANGSAHKGQLKEEPDTSSQPAFPPLAPSSSTQATSNNTTPSAWSAAAHPRIRANVIKNPVFAETFTLTAIDLSNTGKDGRPATLGEVIKQVMAKYKVKIEASANQKTRQTTFHIKTESQKDLDKARRSLVALCSPSVTLVMNAPVSTIGSIIGPKGATLKQIRDQTGVKVDIPKREDSMAPPVGVNRTTSIASSGVGSVSIDDEDEEPTVRITLIGPHSLALEAQEMLNQIISSKTSKTTQRVRNIPVNVLPFVAARRAAFIAAAEGADISLSLNLPQGEITVSGDRQGVVKVVETIKATVEHLANSITPVKLSLPKRQHRLLVGAAADDIMIKANCAVVVAKPEDPSEEIIVWGLPTDVGSGIGAVMQQANSQHVHELPLPGPITFSKQLLTYFTRIGYAKVLSAAHPGAAVYLPALSSINDTGVQARAATVDIVGDKAVVDAVVKQVSEMIGKLVCATKELEVDWLTHRILLGKHAKKFKQFYEAHNVQVFFPPETAEDSSVLLVYDPSSPTASPLPAEKEKHLEEVAKELLKLAKDVVDVKTHIMTVDRKFHGSIVGKGGTTLNAIIGEDKTLSIKVGGDAGQDTEDAIVIRGASVDVDRAIQEITQIVQNAENDQIVNSYSVEFDIDREFVGRIVGAHGSGINKLRDQLGVSVDVSDEVDEKEKESGGKRKKVLHQKSKVKITGRKENVEDAKKRILAQIEKLADETSEVLKIPAQYHSSLIGQGGKYAIRLEERYSVKITFPRQSLEGGEGRTREQLKPDEVLVKGGKKGVAGAKSELLDALEFEKESNNVLKFTVPSRSISHILGRGGVTINEIKDNTDAQIDIDKGPDESGTQITVRGTKKAIAAAKAAIMAISDQVEEEITDSISIDSKFHRSLIGPGGQGLRDLIIRCGGPSDPKAHASLIRFPRYGEPSDEVRLRGEPKLVQKLKGELEKAVIVLKDRVVLGIEIPAAQHRALIGRGGQHLTEFQTRLGVQVQFPGSRTYAQTGQPDNVADLENADPGSIVKVSGPSKACETAIEELKSNIKPAIEEHVTSVTVPLKYHHAVSQQGNFLRNLRSFGVFVDQSALPTKSAVPSCPVDSIPASSVEASGDAVALEVQWEMTLNYQDAEEGDSEWTLKARDEAGLKKAEDLLKEAIDQAAVMSHVGFLTLPDRAVFPRIVGTKGANVSRLRSETGADITLSRENSTIVIIGSEEAIQAAKESIIKIASNPGRPPRRQY